MAIRDAASAAGNYRLSGATLYVTIEPCLMCVGAIVHARIGTVVYGAPEPKAGAIESAGRAHEFPGLNHRLVLISGVLTPECADRYRSFFRRGDRALALEPSDAEESVLRPEAGKRAACPVRTWSSHPGASSL